MASILLVDDSATDRTLLQSLLSRDGSFEVVCASNGREALKHLAQDSAQLVVTDMQMPEMDGLELVTAIRASYPNIPVILITGHGNEALASKALKAGAAGYVPKSQCHELLSDTIHHVFELTEAEHDYQRLLHASQHCHFEFQLENDLGMVPPLQEMAQRMAESMGIADGPGCLQFGIALEQAVKNAMLHGNLEMTGEQYQSLRMKDRQLRDAMKKRAGESPYGDRKVRVSLDITRDHAKLVVADDGPGFDVQQVNGAKLARSLHGEGGHGLTLMWAFMDKVSFGETGNSVTLIKNRYERTARPEEVEEPQIRQEVDRVLCELVAISDGSRYTVSKERSTIGRGNSCDVVLRLPTISHHHCLLFLYHGWWFVKDLQSTNGTKVNHLATTEHLVRPGNILTLGTQDFEVHYSPHDLGEVGITPPEDPF